MVILGICFYLFWNCLDYSNYGMLYGVGFGSFEELFVWVLDRVDLKFFFMLNFELVKEEVSNILFGIFSFIKRKLI